MSDNKINLKTGQSDALKKLVDINRQLKGSPGRDNLSVLINVPDYIPPIISKLPKVSRDKWLYDYYKYVEKIKAYNATADVPIPIKSIDEAANPNQVGGGRKQNWFNYLLGIIFLISFGVLIWYVNIYNPDNASDFSHSLASLSKYFWISGGVSLILLVISLLFVN